MNSSSCVDNKWKLKQSVQTSPQTQPIPCVDNICKAKQSVYKLIHKLCTLCERQMENPLKLFVFVWCHEEICQTLGSSDLFR